MAAAVDQGAYRLYNPNHDAKGRFAAGSGGAGAKATPRVVSDLEAGKSVLVRSEENGHFILTPKSVSNGGHSIEARSAASVGRISAPNWLGGKQSYHAEQTASFSHDKLLEAAQLWQHVSTHDSLRDAIKAARATPEGLRGRLYQLHVQLEHLRGAVASKWASAETRQLLARTQAQASKIEAKLTKQGETWKASESEERGAPMVAAGGGVVQARWQDDLQRVMRFDEVGSDGFHRSWIMLFPQGTFDHPQYGDLSFTHQRLSEIKRLFDQRVRHIDIALDANHDQDKATGWLEKLELRAGTVTGAPAGLWGLVRWTPYGMQLLKDQLYRYFSPEFGPWTDPASGQQFDNVLIGGGLTNRPFLKEMPAVQLADISTKPWASVNKSMLPRSAFLDPGEPDKKSTWRLPVYEGTGPKDADGCYTKRGPLNINGVRAALAALGGAHTGTPMSGVPAGVKAKLEGWLAKYGGSQNGASRQANEAAGEGTGVEDENMRFDEDTQSFVDSDEDNETYADGASADDEESESYADGAADDDEGGDDGDEPQVDRNSDTHGAFDGRHSHGKFAMHTHDGEGDHSDAKLKATKGGAKMSERLSARQLRERVDTQARLMAEMREQLYRRDVADTLAAWDKGRFQFSEAPTSAGGKSGGKALPMVALSKRFRDRYAAFMLNEGQRLSTGERKALNALVETALSAAVVDLSQRGASFDQERRRTIVGGKRGEQARALEGEETLDLAEKRAQARGKQLNELSYDELLGALVEAERQAAN